MTQVKNHYFLLRHGESKANVAQIIISHPKTGVREEFGLTKRGEQQVFDSVHNAKTKGMLDEKTIIYSSPFSRCRQAAEIARKVLGAKEAVQTDARLRERWFGDFENTHNSNYQKVWDADVHDSEHKHFNVESIREIQERILSFIADVEGKHQNEHILLVSHGDTLQILQTTFLEKPSSEHQRLAHLKTGELRALEAIA